MEYIDNYIEIIKSSEELKNIFYIYVFLFFLFIGSFLNVLIYRYPIIIKNEYFSEISEFAEIKDEEFNKPNLPNTLWGRSYCAKCNEKIPFWNNIPLFSWLILKGHSRCCSTPISFRYFFVEFISALLPLLVFYFNGISLESFFYSVAICIMIVLAWIDYDEFILPDFFVYALLWIGLLASALGESNLTPKEAIIAALISYAWVFIIGKGYYLLAGKVGMGEGDYKLIAAASVYLGLENVLYSILVGVLATIILMAHKAKTNEEKYMPFGPGLIIGFIAIMLIKMV